MLARATSTRAPSTRPPAAWRPPAWRGGWRCAGPPSGRSRADRSPGGSLLANVPAAAHRELLGRVAGPPAAAVLSGLRPAEAPAIEGAYRALGLAPAGRAERGGFVCAALVGP